MEENFTKLERKELRKLAGLAYERELTKALKSLEEKFKQWRKNKITAFELSDFIHQFHNGISRDLWSFYTSGHNKTVMRLALAKGIVSRAEVSTGILEKLELPKIYLEKGESMDNKIPDKRAMEKMTSDLSRLLQSKNFASEKELKAYLDGVVKNKKIPETSPKSAVQFAQDIMYEAWEAETSKERIKLAKEALSISPDCADVYNLLAEEEAETFEEAKELYQKGVEAGRRALGEKIFKEDRGHFWGYTPTRPYMRSRAGLMECLWELGEYDEAISHAKEMLKLNRSDNQGIRYILVGYLAELGRYDDLEKFMDKGGYRNDCMAEWLYTKALLAFVKEGDSEDARKELKIAIDRNKYAPLYLIGRKPIPRYLPDRIAMGGEDEGYCYAARNIKAWKRVSGAIEWLREQAGIKIIPKVGRNDMCPCGSGKKFKKCCGQFL